MRNLVLLGLGILIGLVLVLVGWKALAPPYQYQGSLIDPPVKAADFTLIDQDNKPWTLSDQSGNVVVIFFGYTSCTDVCPLTLSIFKQVETILDFPENLLFTYITVDPERDTPEVLKKNLQNFDPKFIGLTENLATLEPVWKDYGVFRQKVETDSPTGYMMDHSATTYIIDQQGNWKLTYPYGTDARMISEDIHNLLSEGKKEK